MIDLHIHSRLSIGELTVEELIERAKDLSAFSIVDNEHCLAYNDIDLVEHSNLVTGVTFTTSIDGQIINIIGYEVNPKEINNYYYERYSKENIESIEYKLFNSLIEIMEKNNIKLSDNIQLTLVEKGVSKKLVYYDAVKNNPDFPFLSYHNFFRDGLSNPFSEYFLNESTTLPPIEEIFDVIRQAGGLVFLAHPYDYGVNVEPLINKLIPLGLDGIEVFHSTAAIRQSLKLLNICEDNSLYASAGSDFRKERYHIPIGLNLHHKIFEKDSFKWLIKYTNENKTS